MVVLNLDNSETRRIVENCYRTQKTLINPLIDWDDDFLYWYIRKENIELKGKNHSISIADRMKNAKQKASQQTKETKKLQKDIPQR